MTYKLKTAIEYWSSIIGEFESVYAWETIIMYKKYIQFLKQPLQLGFFIPFDKEGKPLSMPVNFDKYANKNKFKLNNLNVSAEWIKQCKEYQQACDRKIFTGFELYQDTYFNSYNCVIRSSDMVIVNIENKTIGDIAPLKVEVTDRISKQFKLK